MDILPQNAVTSITHVSRSEEGYKSGSEPLTDQNQESEWTGPAFIGDPRQPFVIDFDTGSSDLWVPSSTCTSPACAKRNKYEHTKSITSNAKPGQFFLQYGDNSTVQGPIYMDTVSVAGIQVTNQYLAAASVLSPLFLKEAEDGLV